MMKIKKNTGNNDGLLKKRHLQLNIPGAKLVTKDLKWHDLIIDKKQKIILDEYIECNQSEQNQGDIKGSLALFVGPSGTGKTIAASAISARLGLSLYRVKLDQFISKYIGETEKNLSVLFAAADEKKIVLLFDEADSLFGKRDEVIDSHNRYANMEVSHLLSLMQKYQGPVILTTNVNEPIYGAYSNCFQVIINFEYSEDKKLLIRKCKNDTN